MTEELTPFEKRIAEIVAYISEHPSKDAEFDAKKIGYELKNLAKEEILADYPKWHKMEKGTIFRQYCAYALFDEKGIFSIETGGIVKKDGYVFFIDELRKLPIF